MHSHLPQCHGTQSPHENKYHQNSFSEDMNGVGYVESRIRAHNQMMQDQHTGKENGNNQNNGTDTLPGLQIR